MDISVDGSQLTNALLAEKDQLFLALVEQAPDGMALIDPDTREFVQFNRAAHEKLGYTKEEFSGFCLGDVEAGQSSDEQIAKIQTIQQQGSIAFDTQHRHKDGSLRDMRVSARCVIQQDRPFIATVFKDVTDLRLAERARLLSQQDFEATFDQAAVGMAHIAPDGRYLRVNTKLTKMLGYTAEELRQQRFQSITHPQDLPNNQDLFARLRNDDIPSYQIEKRYLCKDAQVLWVLVTMAPVHINNDTPVYFIAVIEDISERKQAEEQLHVAAQMLDRAAFAIIATDMDGVICQFNPAAERLLGYSAEDMVSQRTPLCFHRASEIQTRAAELSAELGKDVEPGFRVFTLSLLQHGEETREWTLITRTGQWLSALVSLTLLRDSTGQPQGVLGSLADVSPLRQATEALRLERDRAQRYLDTVQSIIISLDADGRVRLANRYACELLGRSEDDLLGQDWFEACVPAEERSQLRQSFTNLLHCTTPPSEEDVETLIVCAKDSQRLIAWRNSPLFDETGRVTGVLAAGNDITERKAMESARMRALAAAEHLAELKNAFLANMSHEIRTPLNGILGLAEIGRRDHDTQAAGRVFRHIQRAGQHLQSLLNDILDFAKIQAGKLRIRPAAFCLAECLAEIESLLTPQANDKGLGLHIAATADLPAWLLGDHMRLRQILLNLLGNAIKFTHTGEVHLEVSRADDQLLFQVTDTGIGMNVEQLARIFEPFEQADSGPTRMPGGTGLGLPISQLLATAMGGSLRAHSEPDAGSRFELRLPMQATEAPPDSISTDLTPADTSLLAGLHILAVDDVELNLLVLEDLLAHQGAQVTTASNGVDALARLNDPGTEAVDLVLMDVQMPVMDGYEATRRILAQRPDLPVIGLTAHAMHAERERCLNAGMVTRLTKPIDTKVLIAAIQRWRRDTAPALAPEPSRASESPAPNGPQSTLIDWAALHQRFERTPGFVQRLIQTALNSQRDTPDQLRALTKGDDLDACFRLAHSLKGFAGNLFCESLHQQADQLCEQARTGDSAALAGAEPLARTLESLLQELAAHAQE
ncbi:MULTISPECIES: PAS domain-containing hybrid sensor histidine kinase/response regulator [Thiorhodovibrio]|uniref:PAS domain-containing hybrid sensor histidine kinase/response regulator n=1 Tax=Thiorhodovibrio TaxID=61593 RepID=UPI0019120A50|nr:MULTISPECIES: PAS domain S-box protein [Thiorhodovibrio]MBK5969158.1 hypothetical protein [Thiorhodovibrio winogradskyi]WPL13370.1 Autoinducer 2 sensor kinase/phosphatase LuxQ [Thiorhodovibrio litoralis]